MSRNRLMITGLLVAGSVRGPSAAKVMFALGVLFGLAVIALAIVSPANPSSRLPFQRNFTGRVRSITSPGWTPRRASFTGTPP